MKTTRTLLPLLIGALLISLLSSDFASANTGKLTESVFYQNEWIPSVELKAVDIISTSPTGRFCEVTKVNNELIPSVELNEVTICFTNVYDVKNDNKNNRINVLSSGKLLPMSKVNGVAIPVFTCREMTVLANNSIQTTGLEASVITGNVSIAQAGFRKTFDHLLLFVISHSKQLLENLASSWMNR